MKIAITGHTKGLGKALESLLGDNHQVVGFSRSNGYNLADVSKIVDNAAHCDVFINNAYHEYYQCDLLLKMFQLWKDDETKQIVSIGSTVTDYPRIERELDHMPWPYRDHKIGLQRLFRNLIKQPHKCKMLLVSPGAIDTDMIAHLPGIKMSPVAVADIIVKTLEYPLIKEITIYE